MTDSLVTRTKLMVCLGDRAVKSGSPVQAWADLPETGAVEETPAWTYWKKSRIKGATAGSVYRFNGTPTGFFLSGVNAPVFVEMLADKATVQRWQLEHKATNTHYQAARQQRSLQRRDEMERALAPIKRAYESASRTEKAALLAWFITYLTD